jgi:hypothetical protein
VTGAVARAQHDGSRTCAWCPEAIPADARADSIYCTKSCRQAAHRFRTAGYAPRPAATGRVLRMAYADPPYPGLSAKYYADHPDYAGEVDHGALLERLTSEYPDGWALSTSASALPMVLRLPACPLDVRVASWHRGERPARSRGPLNGWEPVVFRGGRPIDRGPRERVVDTLQYVARARLTEANRVTGAKPAKFAWWLFDLLGALPGDTLDDLFPGSGGIGRAWSIYQEGPPTPAPKASTAARRADRATAA